MLAPEDAAHLHAFEAAEIPVDAWGHRAHLRAAYGLVRLYDVDEALLRMRAGIFALNAAHGTPTTMARGYHETLTVAWLTLVAAATHESRALTFEALVRARPELMSAGALWAHYRRETLESGAARARFVTPDVAPLPAV